MPVDNTQGKVRNDIPQCCGTIFFAGDNKLVKITVVGLEDLSEFDVEFRIQAPTYGFDLIKTRTTGITTMNNVISINFLPADTAGHTGVYNYRVVLTSPADEVNTVSYGTITLS